jgi:hypothetical protein
MYENRKMRQAKTVPGVGGGENKGDWWWGEFKYEILDTL